MRYQVRFGSNIEADYITRFFFFLGNKTAGSTLNKEWSIKDV